jgi:FtsH-binding integral membrane protein
MKKPNKQDERVTAQRRKINSEAYGILMLVLLGSILVQQFLLNASFEQYAVEAICFFGMSVYMIVRHTMLGLDMGGDGKRAKAIPFVNSIVAGAVLTAINGVLNYSRYGEHYQADGIGYFIATLAVTFISATVFVFVVLSLINYLNKKRQAQIQKRLDEDEQDNTANE